jgi:hypothetical protein
MDFEITQTGEMNEATEVAEFNPLASLRDRRKAIMDDMFIDIKVPRWNEPEIYVRFRPISAVTLNKKVENRRKQGGEMWSIMVNADILVDACIGIYGVMDGDIDKKFSLRLNDPTGEWTKFDSVLAEAFGMEAVRATDVVMALYLTEGDLIATANKLFEWSGIASNEADESF